MKKTTRATTVLFISVVMISLLLSGCTPMHGTASLTLITRDLSVDSNSIELIGGVDKISDSMYWALIFGMFGKQPTHEAVIERLLERHQADVLLDAELTTSNFGIPYIFMVFSDTVKGQPARFVDGGVR